MIILLLVIITVILVVSYIYFKTTINEILEKLVILDNLFEERYNDLSRAIAQFQKYLPEQKDLIFDIQRAKAEAAKYSKPKTMQDLASKIMNENSLTINLNYLIDKCDFQNISPDLKEYVQKQVDYIQKIDAVAIKYNQEIKIYKKIKNIFPFNIYSKLLKIDLDLDVIKTE